MRCGDTVVASFAEGAAMPTVTAVPVPVSILFAIACVLSAVSRAATWTDTPVARLEALALIESLNAEILSSSSATLTLERWCRDHALADSPQILAHRVDVPSAPPSTEVLSDLQVSSADPVRYRRVELTCGSHVLSVAENWYVPSRLTPEMNRLLDETQTPFGKVVLPLKPHRETRAMQYLWSPLPEGWERLRNAASTGMPDTGGTAAPLNIPPALFEHRAVLYAQAHVAIAEVREVYQRDLLDFPEPRIADAARASP
jgi:hypothetical protein